LVIRWAWLVRTQKTVRLLASYISSLGTAPYVVDVGCAGMWLHSSLMQRGAKHKYVGCDISFSYLSKIAETPDSVKVLCDASHLPFKNNASKIVTAFEVLEHLPDPESSVFEIQRISNWIILVSVPMEGTPLMDQDEKRYTKLAEKKDLQLRSYLKRVGWEKGLRVIEQKTGAPHINVYTLSKFLKLFNDKHRISYTLGAFFYLPLLDRILQFRITRALYLFFERTLFSKMKLFVVYISKLPPQFRPLGNRYGFVILKRNVRKRAK
jgi:hypothetical protein